MDPTGGRHCAIRVAAHISPVSTGQGGFRIRQVMILRLLSDQGTGLPEVENPDVCGENVGVSS